MNNFKKLNVVECKNVSGGVCECKCQPKVEKVSDKDYNWAASKFDRIVVPHAKDCQLYCEQKKNEHNKQFGYIMRITEIPSVCYLLDMDADDKESGKGL